ncbi:MAG: FAD-binding protein, partial [Syntrophobacterales bacterium]
MHHISDILVLGSGLAGLGYALKVADFATVNLVTKREITETSTRMAQGGIAAVLGPDDSFEYHIQDTLTVGEGLSHPDIVELVVHQGPERIHELVTLGAHFDPGAFNGFDLGREGGHSHRRIIHAHDMTGAEIER